MADATVVTEWDRLVAITVVSAKDLKNADWIGTSDPYFKIGDFDGKVIGGNDGGDKCKSQVIDDNLNPVWNETHIFLVDKQVSRFKIRVKDQGTVDALSKEIGATTVMLDTHHEYGKDIALDPQGELHIKYKVTPLTGVVP